MAIKQNFNDQSYWYIFIGWLSKMLNTDSEASLTSENEDATENTASTSQETETHWTAGVTNTFSTALSSSIPLTGERTPTLQTVSFEPEHPADHAAFDFQAAPTEQRVTSEAPVTAPHSTAVFWGDSIAQGMFDNVPAGTFERTIDRATPGAGFMTSIKPQSADNIPKDSVAFIYFGTNDVASLMGQSDEQIAAYARRVIGIAQQMKDQGAEPVLLGLNAPKGAYTGGSSAWQEPGFVQRWTQTMERLNEQYKIQAQEAGIKYAATDAQITERHISADNLHLTREGNRELVNIGVQTMNN